MHTYKRVRDGDIYIWVVGYYSIEGHESFSSRGEWNALKDFNLEINAASYVNYLNGGEGEQWEPLL